MNKLHTPFEEFIFFGKWFSDPTRKRGRKQTPTGGLFSKLTTASLCLMLSFFSIQLAAQETLTISNDTTLCAPAEFCPNATLTDAAGKGIPGVGIVFDVRGANPGRFPLTGSGSTSGSGSCIHCFDFVNAGKDSIIITVDAPGGQISDTICVTTFDTDDKPVAKAKKEYCVYLDAGGQATITPDSLDDGSQAPCGLQGLAIDKSTFSCADIAASPVLVKLTVTGTNGKTASGFTEVTVKDTFPPVITCVDTIKAFLGSDGTVIVDSAYLVAQGFEFKDNCGVEQVQLNSSLGLAFNCFTLGSTFGALVDVKDASGNTSSCLTRIVVVDKESPKLTCPSQSLITIELNPDGLDTFVISESGLFGATDNCSNPPKFSPDSLFFSCADIGTWSKKIVLVDESGNDASCYRNFMVEDKTPPAIMCRYPIDGSGDTLRLYLDVYGQVSISPDTLDNGTRDSCTAVTLTARQTTFTCNDITPPGTGLAINLYATDAFGNIDSCQSIIQVFDTIAPLVFCKDSITVYLDSMGTATVPDVDFFGLIKDECGIQDTVVSRTMFDCHDLGNDVYVDVTVTDIGGRTTTCQVKVIVKDKIAPVLVCKDEFTLELGTDGKATIAANALLAVPAEDNCDIDSLYVSQSDFFCSNIGTYTISTIAVDESGNKSTCTTEVTVVDNMSPTTVCKNITVLVGDGGQVTINPSDVDGGSTDNCGIINMSVHPKTFDCSDVGQRVEVVLTTADASGNSSSCRAWVTVSESSQPVAKCKSEVIVQLDASGQGSIEVADVDDGSSIACNSPSITLNGRTIFDCADIGKEDIFVTLIVTDASGNQDSCKSKIIVQDNIAPMAVCASGSFNLPLGLNGTAILPVNFMDAGSSDACGIETRLVKPNTFTCDDLGLNDVALIVIDSSGNADTCYRVINVVNSSAPNLVCKDIEVYLDADGKVSIVPEDVVDKTGSDCFGNIALTLTDSSFTCADKGANTVTLNLASGSYTNSCTAIVTVIDTLAPIVDCKGDITVAIDAWGVATVTLADVLNSVSDNCDIKDTVWTDVNFSCLDVATSPKEVAVTVTDSSGNYTTCITKVTVVDNSMPVVESCPTDTVLSPQIQCKAAFKFGYPTFSDDCGIVDTTVTSSDSNVNLVMEGDSISGEFKLTTTITFTVTDASGNQTSCDFKIAVEDSHRPTFGNTCPSYPVQYVKPGECGINFVATNLAPQDNCGIDTYICTFRLPNGDIFTTPPSTAPVFLPIGTTTVSHVITDFAGNERECSYTITVEDNEAPTIDFNNNHPDFPLGLNSDGDTIDIPAGPVPIYTANDVDVADNCEVDKVTFEDFLIENNVCASKGYDRLYRCIWTATDKSGNTTQSIVYLRIACPVVNTPDLQPTIDFGSQNYSQGESKDVIIYINEIISGPTNGEIVFFIPNSDGFTYEFDPNQTTANTTGFAFDEQTVDNGDWTVTSTFVGLQFKSNVVIPAGAISKIAIKVTATTPGAKAGITVNVKPGSGGEERTDNNSVVLTNSVRN